MTIKEKYDAIGENFEEVKDRLAKEERIEKYSKMFFSTGDFEALEKCISEKDISNAFEHAHIMKGNSLNIGFNNFSKKINVLVEFVRPREVSDYDKLNSLFEDVKEEYTRIKTIFIE